MTSGIEATLFKVVGRVVGQLIGGVRHRAQVRQLRDEARPSMAQETAHDLLGELSPAEAAALARYLASPDFEQVGLQVVIALMHPSARNRQEHLSSVREQIRQGLRLAVGLPPEQLLGITDVVLDATQTAAGQASTKPIGVPEAVIAQGHVAAAAARTGALLSRLASLREIHEELQLLRSQTAHLHSELRLPHAGTARNVPWDDLYVTPVLRQQPEEELIVDTAVLAEPGQRHVILGDPGAGKSTFAEKLAHDLAAEPHGTVVPLLVVLRQFSSALQAGERTLVQHLAVAGKAPYNVDLTPETVDYLLLNGRAVIILDGLDELTDVALRRRVAELVKGFVLLHPLVPVVATSRRVGYAEASLDPALFRTCALASFDAERVALYARRWFALDGGSSPAERARLADAFLRESTSIEELRSSPLLLSVLCAMFATEHYIPSNRGEVYERCAVMVFDRWDRMRGISRTLGFDGRVRGAVQELAWVLFTEYSPPEQPRSRILRILERYLTTKGFDDDEAAAVAAEFLDYCAGRAWILAEVGSTATESIFGFAHRTFLEFFAAEYLVRMARTPEQVWNVLSTPVRENRWEVVAQLALQRIDRNVDDGGDTVLHLALEEMAEATSDEQAALAQFCSRSLGDVCVSPVLVARLVDMALERACRFGEEDRFLVAPLSEDFGELVAADGPLYDLMYRALPGNLPFVLRCLTDALSKSIEAGNAIALLLATNLSRAVVTEDESRRAVWANLAAELEERHKEAVERWRRAWPWARIRDDAVADEVMNRHGVLPFYVSDLALSGAGYPWVVQLLVQDVLEPADEPSSLPDVAHDVRELLVRRPTPWLPPLRAQSPTLPVGLPTFPVHRLQNDPMPETAGGDDLATWLVLFLPYLEYGLTSGGYSAICNLLHDVRRRHQPIPQLQELLRTRGVPDHVLRFVLRWARQDVDVIGETALRE